MYDIWCNNNNVKKKRKEDKFKNIIFSILLVTTYKLRPNLIMCKNEVNQDLSIKYN